MDVRGNSDIRIEVHKKFGSEERNVKIAAYLCRYRSKTDDPLSFGSFIGVNTKYCGLLMQYTTTPPVGSTLLIGGHGNIFKKDSHTISAEAMISNTLLNYSGLDFVRYCVGFNYSHAQGFLVGLRVARVPMSNTYSLETQIKIPVSSSENGPTFFLIGNACRQVYGPLVGRYSVGVGLGFTYSF